jgi:hypothetical protein
MDFSTVTVTGAQQAFAEEVRAFLGERLTVEVFRTIIAQHDLGLPPSGLPRPQGVPGGTSPYGSRVASIH